MKKTQKKKNKSKVSEILANNEITPVGKLILLSIKTANNPKKFKKALIDFFGKKDIKISGEMSLDEFANEWCKRHLLVDQNENLHSKLIGWASELVHALEELPDMYRGTRWEHLITETSSERSDVEEDSIISFLLSSLELAAAEFQVKEN